MNDDEVAEAVEAIRRQSALHRLAAADWEPIIPPKPARQLRTPHLPEVAPPDPLLRQIFNAAKAARARQARS